MPGFSPSLLRLQLDALRQRAERRHGREFQSLLFTPDVALPALVLALVPLQRWFKRAIARWRGVDPFASPEQGGSSDA